MHELSLCRSIYTIVDRSRAGRPVETIHLQVGHRRQVIPETLEHCWALLTEQTPLEGSVLAVEHVPVCIECRRCGSITDHVDQLLLVCGSCGAADIIVVRGEEFIVTTMDVRREREQVHG